MRSPQAEAALSPPAKGAASRMGAKALLVSAATMLSRLLGLVREQLFAALLGASAFADAFVVAFRIPNLLRDLFAEGALSAAFVPTFADAVKNRGREHAVRLANVVIGALLVVVGILTLLGILFAPQIVAFLAPGFAEVSGKQELAALCTRIMFPFLPLVSLAAVAMGQLNAEEKFGPPAFASAMFNVAAIAGGVFLFVAGFREEEAVIGWSIFTLAGGAAQLGVQLPALFRTGFRLRPALDWAEPGLRRIGKLMAPATVGLAATQVNIFVNTIFASQVPGAPAWLNYAFRLMQLPIGVFGVAVATIATTGLAKRAAERDLPGMQATLAQGLRLVAFLTVPSMAGLLALREPIVRLLFQHGRFTPEDTVATAWATLMYATGLYAYSAVKVVAPAFYALDRSRIPVIASLSAVGANVLLNVTLFPYLSYKGLALGTAAAATVNFLVLTVAFRKVAGSFRIGGVLLHLGRVLLAAAPCAIAAFAANGAIEHALGTESLLARLSGVGAGIAAGAIVYVVACRLLRVAELAEIGSAFRRRLRRA
ncbi:murein biosynthesis integral membrane protein MurJ [Vulgatibacter incomptus]|uniref:Probable lipid II flippase MurJ n=1 Tax=Vulgatibacter incomptus TaxID=1391653 RepID=A0A0K1PG71_9BACT|nr:murein biosynthesis integral membrane protein MurJ [Vulgatibacter incomptus]AKU92515.1 putative peptidoglycan lipid II flippase MurJ [Vulgatibacter incomptus]